MTFALVGALFVTIMACVSVAGYLAFYRQGESSAAILQATLLRMGEAAPQRPSQSKRYQRQLILAGYRQPNMPMLFTGIKIAFGVLAGVIGGVARIAVAPELFPIFVVMLAGGAFGYMLPDRILEYLVKRRSRRLLFGIPTAIDLIVLSLEAGQSLDAALTETTREIRGEYPELSGELNLIQMELLASRGRPDVFRAFRDRNSEPEMKRLAQVFIDSDRFGTSLAPALRNHVRFLRIRLRQQAYEQARKVGVKLVFPVFFLIFPAVILVTLGPALIQIYSQLNLLNSGK